jgi:hypothetical protein
MTSQEHAARVLSLHGRNCRSESLLVAPRTARWWWPVRSQLAKRQIAAEDGPSRGTERACQCHEERRIAVGPRTVRQDQAIATRIDWGVQKSANRYFIRRSIHEFSIVVHAQHLLQPMITIISPAPVCRFSGKYKAVEMLGKTGVRSRDAVALMARISARPQLSGIALGAATRIGHAARRHDRTCPQLPAET